MQNRSQLESYAKAVRSIGCEVYRHRGKILKQKAGTSFQPLWCEKKKIINGLLWLIVNMT